MSSTKTKKKYLSSLAFVIAPLMTVALFTFMGILIFQPQDFDPEMKKQINISFLRNYKEQQVENMDRKKPEKPKEPMQAPEAPKVSVSKPQEKKLENLSNFEQTFDSSNLASGMAVGGMGGGTANNRGLVSLIRTKCVAPRRARMEGITGSITLKFDVNKMGQVENVVVLKSNPPRVFDEACTQNLLRWRFKPKMVEGKPVAVRGNVIKQNMGYGSN